MRGTDERTGALFSYVDLEARVRKDHPLRTIRAVVNEALGAMEREIDALFRDRPALDRARETAAGDAAPGLLLDPI